MNKKKIRRLKFKTMNISEVPPQVGQKGKDTDTIIAKQVSDTEADLYLCDNNGKVLELRKPKYSPPPASIFIRQATPMYIEKGEDDAIFFVILVESEVPFSIKSIKLIREEQQDYDVPFDGFIEEILPLKDKEEDIKGSKALAFSASKKSNYDLFYSIIESDGVEITVTMGDTEKVLFSFMTLSEKYFLAKIFRGMERNT